MRALASDVFSSEQQSTAGGIYALHTGVGSVLAYGLGAIDLVALTNSAFETQVRALSVFAVVIITVMVTSTLLLSQESRFSGPPDDSEDEIEANEEKRKYCW